MKLVEITRFICKATLSNYGLLLLKIVIMIFMTRMMFTGMSSEHYGFWALLWSIFGYSLLLDFGFGTAIQKASSEWLSHQDHDLLSQKVNSALAMYLLMGLVILGFTFISAPYLGTWFKFQSPGSLRTYQYLYVLFGLGSAMVFPTGFFSEILRGIQAIGTRNSIQAVFQILQFVLIWLCFSFDWGLLGLTFIALGIQLMTNVFMAKSVFKSIPHLKLSHRMIQWSTLKSMMSFSLVAYVIMMTNLIIFRTDQWVISSGLGVGFVAAYQIVSKLSDMFRQFTTQLHDALGPISARLFVSSEIAPLKNLLLGANRAVTALAILLFVPLLSHISPLMNIWLGLTEQQALMAGGILLVSMYVQVTLKSSAVQVMLMCDKERILMILAILEGLGNLFLSLYWVHLYGLVGVALGTLVPNLVLALIAYIPLTCRFASVSLFAYLSKVFRSILVLLASLGCAFLIQFPIDNFFKLGLSLMICGLFTMSWILFGLTTFQEKVLVWQRMTKNQKGQNDEFKHSRIDLSMD